MEALRQQEEERDKNGETGFYVVPSFSCSHIHNIDPPKTADPRAACETCGHAGENWVCLTCSKVFCSRYVNGHMLDHGKETGHPLVLSFSDISVWCYDCDSYVKDRKLVDILQAVYLQKFESEMVGVEKDQTAPDSTESHQTTSTDPNIGSGFYVTPITDCPHVEELNNIPQSGNIKDPCQNCQHVGENWLCLSCSQVFCSRYVNGHMALHCGKEGHPVVVSFSDFSTWCYKCDSYIASDKVYELLKALHTSKFGFAPREKGLKTTTTTTSASSRGRGVNGAPTTAEELEEIQESRDELLKKVKQVADLIRKSQHFVAYTGAGISTSANLPDYRGPNGVWTVASQGRRLPPGITLEQALPTAAHMALKVLQDEGILKFLISTNVDGLHRRSGIKEENIAELHGNIYREKCETCSKEYLRAFDVTKSQFGFLTRTTGRKCTCGGALRDTIINFGENLPREALEVSWDHSMKSDLRIVLGTSMRVSPANLLPLQGHDRKGTVPGLVIVNLQRTPFDRLAEIRIFAKTDEFFGLLMRELGLAIPVFDLKPEDLAREMEF